MSLRRRETIDAELERFREARTATIEGVSCQVGRLVKGIHADLFDPNLSVKTLKVRCRMYDNNVSCRFKHEIGMSIKDYIESLRLEAASQLLSTGSFTTFEVAQSLGYRNPQTFYRAFGRRFQCTPGSLCMSGRRPRGTMPHVQHEAPARA